jgi:tetratricopeptide (TPR) repeat protein
MNFAFIKITSIALLLVLLISCGTTADAISVKPNDEKTESKDEKRSLFEKLKENDHLEVEEIIALYHQLKKEALNEYNFENEQELNRYGYMLLMDGKIKSAIEIFKLLVAEFPESGNPYDSLGEAYMKDDNEELALLNYEKSLEIEPNNNHAIDQVTILKGLEILVTDWGKEFFHFPIHFAEEIPYQGVEEVVFPKNWIKPDSSDFWSYVFVWALDNKQEVTAEELATNLTLYFDGLIGGLSRVDKTKLTKARVDFQRNNDVSDSVTFTGKLDIFDGFATQTPITLNARIYSEYCEETNQLILLFRFSPQALNHPIWEKLRTVKVRSTVCEA